MKKNKVTYLEILEELSAHIDGYKDSYREPRSRKVEDKEVLESIRRLEAAYTIINELNVSKKVLKQMDKSVKNLKKGKVGKSINLEAREKILDEIVAESEKMGHLHKRLKSRYLGLISP